MVGVGDARAALDGARTGPVPEGAVGGGTGMICYEYKGGTGTSSRKVGEHTVGVLVQANHGIRDWLTANPQRQNELLWQNPRYVFFREEALTGSDAAFGPRGAQGVALTPGRSIAVDRQSIPYGTPVWLATPGPTASLQRLVLAQDTGSAITGAVRADYFVGWGAAAGELAGRLRQPLQLWALWPKQAR